MYKHYLSKVWAAKIFVKKKKKKKKHFEKVLLTNAAFIWCILAYNKSI